MLCCAVLVNIICFLADHNMANENLMAVVILGMDTIVIEKGGFVYGCNDHKPCGCQMCKRCGMWATSGPPEMRTKQSKTRPWPDHLRQLKPRRLFDNEAEDEDDDDGVNRL